MVYLPERRVSKTLYLLTYIKDPAMSLSIQPTLSPASQLSFGAIPLKSTSATPPQHAIPDINTPPAEESLPKDKSFFGKAVQKQRKTLKDIIHIFLIEPVKAYFKALGIMTFANNKNSVLDYIQNVFTLTNIQMSEYLIKHTQENPNPNKPISEASYKKASQRLNQLYAHLFEHAPELLRMSNTNDKPLILNNYLKSLKQETPDFKQDKNQTFFEDTATQEKLTHISLKQLSILASLIPKNDPDALKKTLAQFNPPVQSATP